MAAEGDVYTPAQVKNVGYRLLHPTNNMPSRFDHRERPRGRRSPPPSQLSAGSTSIGLGLSSLRK